jgi:hypothetical protein
MELYLCSLYALMVWTKKALPLHLQEIQYSVSVILFQLEIEHGMKIISRR